MFKFFRKKTENQQLLGAIKKTISQVNKSKGGCVEVCLDFTKSVNNSELFKSIGYIEESVLKHSQGVIMYAGLILLAYLRSNKLDDADGFLMDVAQSSFVLSSVIINDDEIQKLLLNPASIFIERDKLLEKSRVAWSDWLTMDIETLKKVTMI